jgi:hypothetical protein
MHHGTWVDLPWYSTVLQYGRTPTKFSTLEFYSSSSTRVHTPWYLGTMANIEIEMEDGGRTVMRKPGLYSSI